MHFIRHAALHNLTVDELGIMLECHAQPPDLSLEISPSGSEIRHFDPIFTIQARVTL
jgi:hypothetical protein